jgi:tripartite ATP-independent transporter DctP family solute receptor
MQTMSNRIWSLVSVISVIALGAWLLMAAQPATAADFPKMTIKLGHSANEEFSYHKGTVKFAELVKERTGGAVIVQVFPSNQLGSENDMMQQVKNGVIQVCISSAGTLANFPGWGPVGVFAMPYVLKGENEEEQYPRLMKVLRGAAMKDVSEKAIQSSGIRALDLGWWFGLRHLTTKAKQVTMADDLKGLKIRTPDAPIHKLALSKLGASVTPMAMGELYTALQLGVVDGQENAVNTIFTAKLYEVQKYVTLTGHMAQHNVLNINPQFFDGLSPELKTIFVKSAIEAGDYQSALQLKANKQNIEDLKAKGMVINTVALAEFAEKTKDAWKDFAPTFGPGMYEKLKAEAN